ncbi:hypothetical protein EIP91_012248 [Steccherinum ochraceum]|uniref:Uncharacterized protein n=1 Tax=Steccherinum ochraceum TaxID=92696 RepID=A0A4R0RGY3_9APHY|nr:hypothetical protein EIP91_012248 [Steccherinum ochraceum]
MQSQPIPPATDKRNLIIDSLDPLLAPHIVITSPDFPYDGYWAFVQNGVGPQLEADTLLVPPTVSGNKIEAAAQERLVMYHVIPSLHRKHFKSAVILASSLASAFRRRWDCPQFAKDVETPFHWTDAAEPLLAHLSRDPSSLIIDSAHPCTTPHIVITEAAPQDPWEASANNTPNPQDCAFGYYLTVPSPAVDVVNVCEPAHPCCDDPYFTWAEASEGDGEVEAYDGDYDWSHLSESESGSDDDSPVLLTPPRRVLPLDVAVSQSDDTCSLSTTTKTEPLRMYEDDDDEDGLPPFDDWYMDIAQRAALAC